MNDYLNTCADCGKKVKRRSYGTGWIDRFGATVCRSKESERDGQPILVSADYHYIYGEEQRHFPKRESA